MKPFNEIEKEYAPKEIAESLVFPDTGDPIQREEALVEFRKFRKKITENQTKIARQSLIYCN